MVFEAYTVGFCLLFDGFFIGGAKCQSDALAIHILEFFDARPLFHPQLGAGDEGDVQVIDLLGPGQVIGGGAAFHIDGAVGQERDASL